MFGNVPVGSYLSYQLQDFGRPNTLFVTNVIRPNLPSDERCTEFPDTPVCHNPSLFDLTSLQSPSERAYFEDYIFRDVPQAQALEKRTVLQGESSEWLDQHNHRLTASNFGKVYYRVRAPSDAIFKSIFDNQDLSKVKAISHGRSKEKVARTIYAQKMQKQQENFVVFDAGLTVHPSMPYLAASPDGKVFDPASSSRYGLLEIKCPFSKRDDTLEEAAADPNFYLQKVAGNFSLKRNHSQGYFSQVQGQLALTGLQWCDFCVYLSNTNEMCVDRVYFDCNYWQNTLFPKLKEFYMHHALAFLIEREQDI